MADRFENVVLFDASGEKKGQGTLIIGDDKLTFGEDLNLDYKEIILHAMCTDPDSFPQPCLYLQLERGDDVEEIRLAPQDPNVLQAMFDRMSACAALHPDDMDMEGEGDFFGDSEMFDATSAENIAKMQRLDSLIVKEPDGPPPPIDGQFDEVDEEAQGDDDL